MPWCYKRRCCQQSRKLAHLGMCMFHPNYRLPMLCGRNCSSRWLAKPVCKLIASYCLDYLACLDSD